MSPFPGISIHRARSAQCPLSSSVYQERCCARYKAVVWSRSSCIDPRSGRDRLRRNFPPAELDNVRNSKLREREHVLEAELVGDVDAARDGST